MKHAGAKRLTKTTGLQRLSRYALFVFAGKKSSIFCTTGSIPASLYFYFTAFALLACSYPASAQYNTTAFYTRIYKAADGLPDSYVLNMYQDSRKYLWIGTYSGMSRFDGKNFTNYGIHHNLPDLYVNSILEDEKGRLWITTRKGIGYLRNNIYVHTPLHDRKDIDYVFNISRQPTGKLWAFTSKGVYEFNDTLWVKLRLAWETGNSPCRFALTKGNAVYFCYASCIIKALPDGSYRTIASHNSADGPFFIHFREFNNRLFISTLEGLFEIINDQMVPLFEEQLRNKTIYNFFIDSGKRIWVSTEEDGLLITAPGNEKEFAFSIPLGSNLISSIYEDRDGNIWIANYQGLIKVRASFFDVFTPVSGNIINQYYNINRDQRGNILVNGSKNGFYRFDGNLLQKKSFHIKRNILDQQVRDELIDVLFTDNEGYTWLVTRDRKLIKVSPTGQQEIVQPSGQAGAADAFYHVAYNPVMEKVFFFGHKIYYKDRQGIAEFNTAIRDVINAIVLKNGNMLVNSRTSGLCLVKKNGEAFPLPGKKETLVTHRLRFMEDSTGKIWLSFAGGGLQRYGWSTDSTLEKEREITLKNGLPNDVVEAIVADGRNRLWVATLSGLVVIDTLPSIGAHYVVYNIGKDHNLHFEVNTGFTKLIADNSGNIWLSSYNTVMRFRANEPLIKTEPPVTHIENVTLNMGKTDWSEWSDSQTGYFMLPVGLHLPYDQNTLTFTFNAINYNTGEDTWYSYKLEGSDTAWSMPTRSNMFSLIKLSPGHFTFTVRARNSNSGWSDPAEFSFTIEPPFWQTWWFRSTGILIASLILVFIFRTQFMRISKRMTLQNQLRNLEMKALKAQMNPHFVYNALNSIQSLVIDNRQQEALDYMVKFSRLLRQVLNHSEQNVVTLEKELATLELYIQLEALRLQYSLDYSIEVDESILPENEHVPPLVLQPFVENALWHGLGNKIGGKNLSIHIYANEIWLFCRIADNGVGRSGDATNTPASYREGPRGMDITTNRLSLYNQDQNSDPVVIEDVRFADGSPGGTTVTVRIRRK